jgi:hypothetical protein
MLFLAKYYKRIMTFLSKTLLDERESFTNTNIARGTELIELEEQEEEIMEETTYTTPSLFEKQAEMNIDSKMINDLQEKMNELFSLSEKAVAINQNLLTEN